MNRNHKELISIGLTISIVLLTLLIVHKFIPSIVWAAIIAIATYPLYKRWRIHFGRHENLSAFLFTTIMSLLFLLPLSWLIGILIKESQIFVGFLQELNKNGGDAPDFLTKLPWVSSELVKCTNKN
jgi:predicted PurR-regulated permease PerM